ncbi:MAG: NADH-quinone oxidoreductase subunit M [Chloroflexota bacterium]
MAINNMLGGFPILSIMVYMPIVTALVLLFVKNNQAIRRIAAIGAAINLVVSVVALVFYISKYFNAGIPQEQSFDFQEYFVWLPDPINIGYHMGADALAILLLVLTTLLTLISILVSWEPIQKRVREYYMVILFLQAGMMGVFVSLDFFVFYIFWEIMLVPMALLIGIWGSSNRVYAAVKFFLYTLSGSLLMLVAIIALYLQHGTLDILMLQQLGPGDPRDFQNWVFLAFAAAFAVKVPMWPFHTWLPDAHVEAPTAGSIILAGVLLKMGAFGFIRFALPITPAGTATFAPIMVGLSVIAILYGAMVSLVQPDLKKLIAYSSVSHMGFVTLGLFTGVWLNELGYGAATQGIDGAIVVMLSHGLLTGGLFLCVGAIYNRLHSRLIADMGGMAKPMPVYAMLFMIMMLGSVGLPGFSGFIGEFLTMLGAFRANWVVGALTTIVIILSAWYLFWMFQRVLFNKTNSAVRNFRDASPIEAGSLIVLGVLSLLIGILPTPLLDMINPISHQLLTVVSAAIPNVTTLADFFK